MKEILFGWITKPKLMVTWLDEVTKFSELLFVISIIIMLVAYFDIRAKRARKKEHNKNGKYCTCIGCMQCP